MAKKSKVSVDDFAFIEEEESQPLNIIAKSIFSESKPLAEREQSVSNASPKALAKREQSVSIALAESDIKNESVSNASPKALAKREQSVSIALAESDILGLIGKERKLLFFIYQKCESSGALETPIITTEELLKILDVSPVRLRNLIFRLQDQKTVIKVTQVHLGRSGWRKFALEKEVFQYIRLHLSSGKALAEREQSVSNASPKALAYPLAEPPYSSSNNLNIITTNTGESDFSAEITLPVNLARFGISKNNLQKLVDDKLCTLEIVQKSIEALSFDVENGKTGNLAAILFGVLRSGKEYISQKYSESLQQELEQELKRIQETKDQQKRLLEIKLQEKFKTFVDQNPQFIESIKSKHSSFVTSYELLEKIAFEEFKSLTAQN